VSLFATTVSRAETVTRAAELIVFIYTSVCLLYLGCFVLLWILFAAAGCLIDVVARV